MNILLIGGNGYIGSAFVEKFRAWYTLSGREDVTLTILDKAAPIQSNKPVKTTIKFDYSALNDIIQPFPDRILEIEYIQADYKDLDVLSISKYDCIILLAGNSSVGSCLNINNAFNNNVSRFQQLLSIISIHNSRCHVDKKIKFIYASSASVYGNNLKAGPTAQLEMPLNAYDATKQICDIWASIHDDIEIHALRFGTVSGYSPNMRWDLLVNAMYKSITKTGNIIVTSPERHRAVLDIEDLFEYVRNLVYYTPTYTPGFKIHNVASFNSDIKTIAKMISAEFPESDVLYSEKVTTSYDFQIFPIVHRPDTNSIGDIIRSMIKSLKNAEIN